MYKLIFKHLIAKLDAEICHEFTINTLGTIQKCSLSLGLMRTIYGRGLKQKAIGDTCGFKHFARAFPGYLGLAAGMDKNALAPLAFAACGFAFVEVGTITPRPQPGNEAPRLWRLLSDKCIRNRMGFNNDGVWQAATQLCQLRSTKAGRSIIVGANIGKNKITPADKAVDDYVTCARELAPWADYLVINVSSPNTPGLRDLQNVESLREIVVAVKEVAVKSSQRDIPVLIKIAPDLHDNDIKDLAAMVKDTGIAGVIATNTTIKHPYGDGGVSGPVLFPRALEVVSLLRKELGPDPVVIACGGITTVADAKAMLKAGADLLQGFTALIYNGPAWPGKINRALLK